MCPVRTDGTAFRTHLWGSHEAASLQFVVTAAALVLRLADAGCTWPKTAGALRQHAQHHRAWPTNATRRFAFNPTQAGNLRIEGLYFDQQTPTYNAALFSGSEMRIGVAAQSYPFPSPTGIADYKLRTPAVNAQRRRALCAQMLSPSVLSAIRCRQFNRCVGPDDLSAILAPNTATPQLHVDRGDRFLDPSERWGLIPHCNR